VITAASPGAGGGAAALLPPRIVDLEPAPSGDEACGVRECVVSEASGALRARAAQRLDAWLGRPEPGQAPPEPAQALRDWFGPGVVAEKRWLLPALDRDIADVDALISAQVNAILHAALFQRLEARWRGLDFLTDVAELSPIVKVRMLSLSWSEVARDLDRAADFDHSQLFHNSKGKMAE